MLTVTVQPSTPLVYPLAAAAARAAARAVGAAARGHASWFRAECELRELLGSMRELASVQAASGARPDAGAPAESRVEPAERVG
jgi:hypothetical protein